MDPLTHDEEQEFRNSGDAWSGQGLPGIIGRLLATLDRERTEMAQRIEHWNDVASRADEQLRAADTRLAAIAAKVEGLRREHTKGPHHWQGIPVPYCTPEARPNVVTPPCTCGASDHNALVDEVRRMARCDQ